MYNPFIFKFKTDISRITIPEKMNNPFGLQIPEIANIAALEFQQFIELESKKWSHDFRINKGKMFGVLVIQKVDNSLGYLGTISGKISGTDSCENFIPSIFDDSTDDFFINKGMKELTTIGKKIENNTNQSEINLLKENRRQKSFALQQKLFENYRFLNVSGEENNVLQIFKSSSHGNPPAAAGECAAPKLLHFAFKNELKPIAIAEFWWGNPPKSNERVHKDFYPACKNKCRPILEFMLGDTELYNKVIIKK